MLSPSRFLLTLCASGHFGRQLSLWQWTVPHVSYPALRQHQALVKGKTAWHIPNVKFEVATLYFSPGAHRSQQAEMAETVQPSQMVAEPWPRWLRLLDDCALMKRIAKYFPLPVLQKAFMKWQRRQYQAKRCR